MEQRDHFWRAEVSRHLRELRAATSDTLAHDQIVPSLDRPLLYSAFVVRKLIEDGSVTDALRNSWLEVRSRMSTREGQPPFLEIMFGELKVEDHFDLSHYALARMSYSDIASEVIHSDGLVWLTCEEGRPNGFLVFSYRNALKRLIAVRLDQYVSLLETVIADRPERWFIVKDLASGKTSREIE